MDLNEQQRADFERDGFLIFPELFSAAEVAILRGEVERLAAIEAEGVFREGEDGQAKAILRLHEPYSPTYSPAFRAATRTPRALRTAMTVLGDDQLYLHHTKMNMKPAIEGTVWHWHQDFGSWHLDGVAEPDMVTMAVLLDEATPLNGCLYLLPGSHKDGWVKPYLDTTTSYHLWAMPPARMREYLAKLPEPVPLVGPPGTAAMFLCNNMHASGHNLSHRNRWQAYFCYNRVSNRPKDVENPRPDYVRSQNWEPMTIEADDGILRSAPAEAAE